MNYTLMHFDTPLVEFSAEGGVEASLRVLETHEENRAYLPLDLAEVTPRGLESWIRHRSIPKNRAYVDNLLSVLGLSANRPLDLLRISKGLSLNDCYWVKEEGSRDIFDAVNLYDNRFSRVLGQIAFTGYGSSDISGISSSPEFTTNGMLPKCWRRLDGRIVLFKGGTMGASNAGYEPYSEFYASQLAEVLGVDAVPYGLSRWKGLLCSTCELFTSKERSFVPVGRIVRTGGMQAVRKYYEELGGRFTRALDDMILFDALIFNTDRHYGNFGFLVDSRTNRIIAPAPLFDHGNSLFNFAGPDALKDQKSFLKYAKTQMPCVYDDFVGEARKTLPHERKNALRGLLGFRFRKHRRYNLPAERLSLIETAIQQRVAALLEEQ